MNLWEWVKNLLNITEAPATTEPENRRLSEEEAALIEWLLRNGTADAQNFLPQLRNLTVTGGCNCGCPTIDLQVDDDLPYVKSQTRVLADFQGTSGEDLLVHVMLHQSQGRLGELEIYSLLGKKGRFGLPSIEGLSRN